MRSSSTAMLKRQTRSKPPLLSSYSVFTQSGNGNTTFRATGLKPDTNYFFIVGASDASGLNLSTNNIIEGTTPAGPPASLTIQAFPTSVVAGSATTISVSALDAFGKPSSSNVDIELTASTGQSWMVPVTGRFRNRLVHLYNPGGRLDSGNVGIDRVPV